MNRMSLRRCVIASALLIGTACALQAENLAESEIAPIQTEEEQPSLGFGNGSFIVAPVPFSSPMIGTGLALGGAYLFQMDEGSGSSTLGIGGLKSDNGSTAYGLNASIAMRDNRWQADILAAQADLNYDLISSVGTVPLRQTGLIGRLELAYGFTPDLSLGFQARYMETEVSVDGPGVLPPDILPAANLTVASYGLIGEYDRRDSDIFATTGTRVYFSALQSQIVDGVGEGEQYAKAYVNWDFFRPLGTRVVMATRMTACAAEPNTPFYDLCSLGGTDSMRGFNITQFLDERLLSAQIEFRISITERIGMVAFAGTGAVGDSFDALNAQGTAGGLGVRYRVSKKFPVEFAVDVSQNDDNEQLLYIYVGQRF